MSFDAIRWAMAQDVEKSSAKFVLVAMADCVNMETGSDMLCWPSYRHLAARTGQDLKTVEAGVKRLRDAAFVLDTGERQGRTGSVVVYRLNTTRNGVSLPMPEPRLKPSIAPENGGASLQAAAPTTAASNPTSGATAENNSNTGFPVSNTVFPVKRPQIPFEATPKTGGGISNGTRDGTNKEPVKKARQRAADLLIPGVSLELQGDWTKVREKKRAGPITQTVIDGLLREAGKAGISAADAVTFCCEAGWQGFNAGWYADRTGRTSQRPGAPTETAFQRSKRDAVAEFTGGLADRKDQPKDVSDGDSLFIDSIAR